MQVDLNQDEYIPMLVRIFKWDYDRGTQGTRDGHDSDRESCLSAF